MRAVASSTTMAQSISGFVTDSHLPLIRTSVSRLVVTVKSLSIEPLPDTDQGAAPSVGAREQPLEQRLRLVAPSDPLTIRTEAFCDGRV